MNMREIITRLEWEQHETDYRFERLGEPHAESARLTTSGGVQLEMPKEAWCQLALAIDRLFTPAATTPADSKRFANTGKPWTVNLDDQLHQSWEASAKSAADVRQLAAQFGRSRGGITSRLTRLGLLLPDDVKQQ